jgi:hypothetical protein
MQIGTASPITGRIKIKDFSSVQNETTSNDYERCTREEKHEV